MRVNDIRGIAGMSAEQDRKMRVFLEDEGTTAPELTELARIANRLSSLQHDTTELAGQLCIVADRALGPVPTGGATAVKDKGGPTSAIGYLDEVIDGINARLAIAFEAAQRLGRLV